MFHKIKSVTPLPDYVLLVHFTDGTARQYDVKPLLESTETFRSLRAVPGLFDQAAADPGGYGVSWNDDLDLSCEELWANGVPVSTADFKISRTTSFNTISRLGIRGSWTQSK